MKGISGDIRFTEMLEDTSGVRRTAGNVKDKFLVRLSLMCCGNKEGIDPSVGQWVCGLDKTANAFTAMISNGLR